MKENIGLVVSNNNNEFRVINIEDAEYTEHCIILSNVYYNLIGEVISYQENGVYQVLQFENLNQTIKQNILKACSIYINDLEKILENQLNDNYPIETDSLACLQSFWMRYSQ